jgi:hypothetical protein
MILTTLTTLGLSDRRADFTDLTLVALFTYMSLLAARNIALLALVAAPVIVRHGTDALRAWRQRMDRPVRTQPARENSARIVLNWVLVGLVVTAAATTIAQQLSPSAIEKAKAEILPVTAIRFLRAERPIGQLFNSYNWGGYLIWELPEYPVFVDGRTDLYDDEFLTKYLSIVFVQEGWEAKLDNYDVNLVLIEPQSMLGRMLSERALNGQGWSQVYLDEMAAIFVRK